MAFDPIVKDPDPEPAPPAPDPMAAVNAQLAEMRQQINNAYQQSKGLAQPQIQYIPVPVQPQAPEPVLTEAEALADIPAAIRREAERIAAAEIARVREEVGSHIGTLYTKDFDRDLKDLSTHPYYKGVADQLSAWVEQHPEARYTQGALQQKFHELVGQQAVSRPIEQYEQVERMRAVDVAVPVSTSPVPARRTQREITLDPVREEMRREMERAMKGTGFTMSPREWVEIESGRALSGTKWVDDTKPLPDLPEVD